MLSASDMAAIAVLVVGIGVADIAWVAQQQGPDVWEMAQYSAPPSSVAPEIEEGRNWLERKRAEQERAFQAQQRQQAEDRRDLRLERRLDAEHRIQRDLPARR